MQMAISLKKNRDFFLFNTFTALFLLTLITSLKIYALTVSPLELSVDEAQYWDWSNKFDFGYFSKPPLIAWLISISTSVFGNDEWSVRLFAPIIHFFISIILWITSSELFNWKSGTYAALIWSLLPLTSFGSFIISTDTPLLFFWSLCLLSTIKIIKNESKLWSILLGISIGLGFLSKYAIVYFAILVTVFWILHNRNKVIKFNTLAISIIITLIIISPNIYWNTQNGLSTLQHTIHNADITGFDLNLDQALIFFCSQFIVFGPILFLIYIFAVWNYFFQKLSLSTLAMFSAPILFIILLQALLKTANANWAATAYPAACILISGLLNKKNYFLKTFIWFGVFLNFLLFVFILKISITGKIHPINLKSDPLRKLKGFQAQSISIKEIIAFEKISGIVFDKRSDITRFNYYLNRNEKNKHNIYFLTNNVAPNNHYEYFYNFKNNNFNGNEKFIIITRNEGLEKGFINLFSELEPLDKFVFQNSANTKRTIYIMKATLR